MPTVDVIIPAFNAARFLAQTLESVITQDFADWRIILVNDGSTDTTAEIARLYQKQLGDKMLVITQANAGLPAARNAAIRASTAEFLAILDSDDIWLPGRLSSSLRAFEGRPQAGLSYGLIQRIDERGVRFSTFTGNKRDADGRIASAIFTRQVELPCPTVTLRRSCLDKVGLFDETMRATEDRDLWLRVAKCYEVAFVPEIIALYRTYSTSMSADMGRMLQSQLQFIAKHRGSPGCGLIPSRMAEARVYKQRGEVFLERGQHLSALRNALLACCLWPLDLGNLRTLASILVHSLRASLQARSASSGRTGAPVRR